MKNVVLLLFLLYGLISFSQAPDTIKNQLKAKSNIVSFVTKLDIRNAMKDGFYLNGYIVEIDYYTAQKISGKKIRITGEVTLIKGLKNDPEYRKGIQKQGRLNDAKHIYNPKIEVLN